MHTFRERILNATATSSAFAGLALLSPILPIVASAQDLVATTEWQYDGGAVGLAAVGPVAFGPEGLAIIGQSQDRAILMLDSQGTELGTIGRGGSGPGEFRWIGRLGFVDGTIWALDPRMQSVSTFESSSREFLRRTRLDDMIRKLMTGKPAGALQPVFMGLSSVGSLWGIRGAGNIRELILLGGDGREKKLGRIQTSHCFKSVAGPGGHTMAIGLPHCAEPMNDVSSNGKFIVMLDPISGGRQSEWRLVRIHVEDGGSDTLMIPLESSALSAAEKSQELASVRRLLGNAGVRSRSISADDLPDHYPSVQRVIVGNNGRVLLVPSRQSPASAQVLLIEWKDGPRRVQGFLGAIPIALEADRVLAIREAENGEQMLVSFRIAAK